MTHTHTTSFLSFLCSLHVCIQCRTFVLLLVRCTIFRNAWQFRTLFLCWYSSETKQEEEPAPSYNRYRTIEYIFVSRYLYSSCEESWGLSPFIKCEKWKCKSEKSRKKRWIDNATNVYTLYRMLTKTATVNIFQTDVIGLTLDRRLAMNILPHLFCCLRFLASRYLFHPIFFVNWYV